MLLTKTEKTVASRWPAVLCMVAISQEQHFKEAILVQMGPASLGIIDKVHVYDFAL